VNHKRLFRIYREERLMVGKRGGRKRALGMRAPMPVPGLPNDRWSLDFVADQFVCGRRFRISGLISMTTMAGRMLPDARTCGNGRDALVGRGVADGNQGLAATVSEQTPLWCRKSKGD
jgi:hypothetical protein